MLLALIMSALWATLRCIFVNETERYSKQRLPFGLFPTEETIGSYWQKHSVRALRRVYSVEATFGFEKRCFHRYETGGEPRPSLAV